MSKIIKFILVATASVALVGCTSIEPTSIDAGEGPAAEQQQSTAPAADPSADASAPAEPEASDSDGGTQGVATFKEKYSYADGVDIEVTKVGTRKLTESGYVDDESITAGEDFTVFSIRVKNGSETKIDTLASALVTYGPDGEEAVSVYDDGVESFDGMVLPGKAKTGSWGFVIPDKYQDDVTLEFSFDFDHETAVFAGSVK